ncbi:MAG: hypothetical protein V9G98_16950 [Candidatus Competibacter sp.]
MTSRKSPAVERVVQELGVPLQLVGLLAHAEREADLVGRVADAKQHVANMQQRLLGQRAREHHVLVVLLGLGLGGLGDIHLAVGAQQVLVGRRDKRERGRVGAEAELAKRQAAVGAAKPGGIDLAGRRGGQAGDRDDHLVVAQHLVAPGERAGGGRGSRGGRCCGGGRRGCGGGWLGRGPNRRLGVLHRLEGRGGLGGGGGRLGGGGAPAAGGQQQRADRQQHKREFP